MNGNSRYSRNDREVYEYTTDELRELLSQPNGTENADIESGFFVAVQLFFDEQNAQACAFLCRACKKKSFCERLNYELDQMNRSILADAIADENPKLRKNTARLIGVLGVTDDASILADALTCEQTKFVIPSILLALGALGGKIAFDALNEYPVAPAQSKSEEKHVQMIIDAKNTALSTFCMHKKHKFCGLTPNTELHIDVPCGLNDTIRADFSRVGIRARAVDDFTVSVTVSDTRELYSVRSFREALFPLGSFSADYDVVAAIKAVSGRYIELLKSTHDRTDEPFFYRIEIGFDGVDRGALAHEIKTSLQCAELVNSVTDYETEIIIRKRNGRLDIYAKLCTIKDHRFDYRVASISASIHPSNAAGVISYARDNLKENARVLDVCCGSGTMLFEREKFSKCEKLMGVDISPNAISAAKENCEKANSKTRFVCKDCRKFILGDERKYNELISNLPFGNRVGTHNDNERLYRDIFALIPNVLQDGATIILYTMEERLMTRVSKSCNYIRFVKKVRAEAGGLYPTIFVFTYCALPE